MATISATWTAGNGDWLTAGNWQEPNPAPSPAPPYLHYEPSSNNDVALDDNAGGSGPGIFETITYNTTDTVNSLSGGDGGVLLAINGGSLTSANGGTFSGTINIASGATFNVSAGTEAVVDGASHVDTTTNTTVLDGGTVAGTIGGAGDFEVFTGKLTLNAGTVLTVGTFEIGLNLDGFGATVLLNTDLTYGGTLRLDNLSGNNALLELNGHSLTLTGTAALDASITGAAVSSGTGTGTLTIASTATATLSNGGYSGFNATGTAIINKGTIIEDQRFVLAGTFDNQANATFNLTQDHGIDLAVTGTAATTNEGLIEKTGGIGTSTIYGSFSSTGTIDSLLNSYTDPNTQVVSHGGAIKFSGAGGSIAGVLEGAGEIDLAGGGTYTLASGLTTVSVATFGWFDVGTTIVLGKSISYGGVLDAAVTFGNLTINLGGYTLTATKELDLTGAYGAVVINHGGTVMLASGATSALGGVNIAGGVLFENAGTLTANYDIYLDSDSASTKTTFQNDASGTIVINQARTIFSQTGTAALITNAGAINVSLTAGSHADIYDAVTNTGTIKVDGGELQLHTGGTLSGTLSGTGQLTLRGGKTYTLTANLSTFTVAAVNVYDQNTDLVLGKSLTYAGVFTDNAYEASNTIDLGGFTLTLSGTSSLTAPYATITVTDGGTILITSTGNAELDELSLTAGVIIENAGTVSGVNDVFNANSGSAQTLFQNDASGIVNIVTDGTIFSQTGTAALITNAGLIEKTTGNGISQIAVALTNTGTIEVDAGEIDLEKGGQLGGTIKGPGALGLRGGGAYTLNSTLTLSIATLNIYDGLTSVTLGKDFTYAGTLNDGISFSTTTLDLGKHTLTLTNTASFSGAYGAVQVTDGGKLLIAQGAAAAISGTNVFSGVTVENAGTVTIGGFDYLNSDNGSAQALLQNDATGILYLTGDNDTFDRTGTAALITNAGKIDKIAGTGRSDIHVALTNTGTFAVDSGEVALYAGGTLGGTVTGAGVLTLRGGGSYTLSSGVALSVATLNIYDGGTTVTLGADMTYAGVLTNGISFSTTSIDLAKHTLTLTGTANFAGAYGAAQLTDGGKVLIAQGANATISGLNLFGGVTFENAGTVVNGGYIGLDSDGGTGQSLFQNDASGLMTITDGTVFSNGGTTGVIANAGIIAKTTGTSTADISDTLNNTGSLVVSTGKLALHNGGMLGGTVTGAGEFSLGGTTTYTLSTGVALSVGQLDNSATTVFISQDLTFAGTYVSTGELGLNGHTLTLGGTSSFLYGGYQAAGTGTLRFTGTATMNAVVGSGVTLEVDNAGHLELDTSQTYGKLLYGAGRGSVTLTSGVTLADPISGFAQGDTLDLAGVADKTTYQAKYTPGGAGGTLQVIDTGNSNSVVATFTMAGNYANGTFTVGSDGASGTPGTLIGYAATTSANISGPTAGNKVDLATTPYAASDEVVFTATSSGGTLLIVNTAQANAVVGSFKLTGSYGSGVFTLASDGASGTYLGFVATPALGLATGNVETSAIPGGAPLAVIDQYNSDGSLNRTLTLTKGASSYTYHYAGGSFFTGKAFASFDNVTTTAGALTSQTLYNARGIVTQQTQYNSDGSLYEQDTVTQALNGNLTNHFAGGSFFTGKSFAAFDNVTSAAGLLLSQTLYNSSGVATQQTLFNPNGTVYLSDTITKLSSGNIDYHYGSGSFFTGKAYSSYDTVTTSAGTLVSQTQADSSGLAIQSLQFNADGSLNIKDTASKLSNGNIDYHFAGGSFFTGKAFVAFDNVTNASGVLQSQTLLDATGAPTQITTFNANGSIYQQATVSRPATGQVLYHYAGGSFFTGKSFSAFDNLSTTGNTLLEQELYNNDGSHGFTVPGSNLTLTAAKNDTFNVTGSNETVRFGAANFGNDVFSGYKAGDVFSFATSIFANYAALSQHVTGTSSAVITDASNDTLTLTNVAANSLAPSMFRFT